MVGRAGACCRVRVRVATVDGCGVGASCADACAVASSAAPGAAAAEAGEACPTGVALTMPVLRRGCGVSTGTTSRSVRSSTARAPAAFAAGATVVTTGARPGRSTPARDCGAATRSPVSWAGNISTPEARITMKPAAAIGTRIRRCHRPRRASCARAADSRSQLGPRGCAAGCDSKW